MPGVFTTFYQGWRRWEQNLLVFGNLLKKVGVTQGSSVYWKATFSTNVIALSYPTLPFQIHLRGKSSDLSTLSQNFFFSEMDLPLGETPRTIIDAGANIGLSTLALMLRYPKAKYVCLEPQSDNFAILRRNLGNYANAVLVEAALWYRDAPLELLDHEAESWAFQVRESQRASSSIRGTTIDNILSQQRWHSVDLLKIDIEGSEKEVFEHSDAWIGRVRSILVEPHDRLKPGCTRAIYHATQDFPYERVVGEKLLLSRAPLNPPS